MARKKKHEEHVNHERWLVSYADFITLLFAFFVVMFAVSQVDSAKLGRFVESVQEALGKHGVFEPGSPRPMIFDGSGGMSPIAAGLPFPERYQEGRAGSKEGSGAKVARELARLAEDPELVDKIVVRVEPRGTVISLLEVGFFDSGRADARGDAMPLLGRIAETLREGTTPLRFEGHADSRPIRSDRYPSNWELSAARALHILHYFESSLDFEGRRLSASVHGEHAPLAANDTPAGRARNRRVDIVLLNARAQQLEPLAHDQDPPEHDSRTHHDLPEHDSRAHHDPPEHQDHDPGPGPHATGGM